MGGFSFLYLHDNNQKLFVKFINTFSMRIVNQEQKTFIIWLALALKFRPTTT